MKKYILFLLFISLEIYSKNSVFSTFEKAISNRRKEVIHSESLPDIEDISFFYAPIEFTPKGTRCFFSHVFDHEKYCSDFLPYNLIHLRQFLDYERREVKSAPFAVMILRTFNNKLRAIKCLDAQEFFRFIYELPQILSHHISPNHEPTIPSIYDRVSDDYEQIKKWRNNVWADLNQCLELCGQQEKMIEIMANKVMWVAKDGQKSWQLFKNIYEQINNVFLANKNIGYDISWTLVYRFIDFISLFGSEIPLETYEQALSDIREGKIKFNTQQELALGIKTQDVLLKRALEAGKIDAQARQNFGIVTDKVVPLIGGYTNRENPVQVIESIS